MSDTGFIAVFRPRQRPAWAQYFDSRDEFVRDWANGAFRNTCHAEHQGDQPMTWEEAVEDVGHDLNSLTILESPDEAKRYLSDHSYAGHHNRGEGAVKAEALLAGWIEEPAEDDEDEEEED